MVASSNLASGTKLSSVRLCFTPYFFIFHCLCGYNGIMMNNCDTCSRKSFTDSRGCNYCNSYFEEYKYTMPACIKNQAPNCMAKAVIPSISVETSDGMTNLANCFVHVIDINTTYYIDDKHRPMIVWAGNVEVDLPADISTDEEFVAFIKSFGLRSQYLYCKYHSSDDDLDGIISIYFDKTGKPYWAGEYNEITEGPII